MAAMTSPITVRIAMLNADTPVPNVLSQRGSYGNIFHSLLSASAARLSSFSQGQVRITAQDFDVVRGQYPPSLADYDAIIITGSYSSAYDQDDWCLRLDRYVLDVYENHPGVKIFGSCFGHQIICQSLLRKHGAIVEKQPSGYELGVHEITLTDEFRKAFAPSVPLKTQFPGLSQRLSTPDSDSDDNQPPASEPASSLSSLRLQFIHADHVHLPPPSSPADQEHGESTLLPPDWILMGGTAMCAVQGVYQPGRIFTYQGHFEFDRFVNSETVRVFGSQWDPKVLQGALDAMDNDDDAGVAADLVVKFLLEGRQTAEQGMGGLMTPPLGSEIAV